MAPENLPELPFERLNDIETLKVKIAIIEKLKYVIK